VTVRVAIAGAGAWGRNLVRVLASAPRAELIAVADVSAEGRARAAELAPGARIVGDLRDALALGVDAAVIATPPASHAALALLALEAGADVLVEKPLALTTVDAERCVAAARARGRVGMVGHLLRYHPGVTLALELAAAGELGELVELSTRRLSAGGSAAESAASVLWRLGPHDLAVLDALGAGPLDAVRARAAGGLVAVEARAASGVRARLELSRTAAHKERRVVVRGAEQVAVIDDVRAPGLLLVGPAGARGEPRALRSIRLADVEPLAVEIDHFLSSVESRVAPPTPLEEGARVVGSLARAEASLAEGPRQRRSTVISASAPARAGGPVVPRPG
jgi:predicted dehydrogenase